jgi:tetratricopeptide (TPR) repeat protein
MKILQVAINPLDHLLDSNYDFKGLAKYQEAIDWCNQAIRQNPNDVDNYLNKSYFLFLLNRYQEAIECCDIAININPNDENTYLNKGYVLNEYGQAKQALACFNQAISINSNSYDAHLVKGNLLMDLERYREAIECFSVCLKLIPGDIDATKRNEFSIRMLKKAERIIQTPSSTLTKSHVKTNYYQNISFRILQKNQLALNKLHLKIYYGLLMHNMKKRKDYHDTTQILKIISKEIFEKKKKKNF